MAYHTNKKKMTNQTKILLGVAGVGIVYLLWKNSKGVTKTTRSTTKEDNVTCNIGEELVRLPSGEIVCINSELLLDGLNEIAKKYNIPCRRPSNPVANYEHDNIIAEEYCPKCEEYDKAEMLHLQEAGLLRQQAGLATQEQFQKLLSSKPIRESFNCKPCIKNIVCVKPSRLQNALPPQF